MTRYVIDLIVRYVEGRGTYELFYDADEYFHTNTVWCVVNLVTFLYVSYHWGIDDICAILQHSRGNVSHKRLAWNFSPMFEVSKPGKLIMIEQDEFKPNISY